MQSFYDYLDSHHDQFLAELMRYLRQPSVAAQNLGMTEMAALAKEQLEARGFNVQILPTDGHPVVYGELGNGGSAVNTQSPSPVNTAGIPGNKAFTRLAAGFYHTCGVTAAGGTARRARIRDAALIFSISSGRMPISPAEPIDDVLAMKSTAPSSSALIVAWAPSRVSELTISTGTGVSFMIRSSAWIPSIRGISTSSVTTSGRSAATFSIASAPSRA